MRVIAPRRLLMPALGLALAAPASAQRFSYSAGTAQYRLTVHSAVKSDQIGDLTYDMQERMTLRLVNRATDTLGLTITLDSVTGKLPTGAPIDGTAMLGLRLSASMSPAGRIYSRDSSSGPGVKSLGRFADELYRFLPVVPTSLATGVTWSDTISAPIQEMGTELSRNVVTTYRVTGDTTLAGESAWKIERVASISVNGTGTAAGQPVKFQSVGEGSGLVYVGRSGRFLGEDVKDDLHSTATLTAVGKELANTQSQVTKVTLLR